MYDPLEWIPDALRHLTLQGLRRARRVVKPLPGGWCEVEGRRLRNFAGNDYLDLAHDPRLIAAAQSVLSQAGTGTTASALVTGRTPWHVELEETLAGFHGTEAAVLFPTGYAANVGTIAALAGPEDTVYCDRFNHACVVDGCRLSGARFQVYRHPDPLFVSMSPGDRLEKALQRGEEARRRWIVTDGLFSMDGDLAPLPNLVSLAQQYRAGVIVDEAHAVGLLGVHGRGTAEYFGVEQQVVRIGTLSKALGCLGGYVCGPAQLIDWLWNSARTQMFSTSLPAPMCAAATQAVRIIREEPFRRELVLNLADQLRLGLRKRGWKVPAGIGPVVPIIIGDPITTLMWAEKLGEAGFHVGAIRPPTVPQGTSRLRLTVTAAHSVEDVQRIMAALQS